MPRRAGLSAALVELTKAQLRHLALRGVALKLAPARDVVVRLVVLRAALRDGRLLVQGRRVALKGAPAKLALVRAVMLRAVALRAVALKLALHAPAPLARPGAERLLVSAKIHVSRPKVLPVNAASIRRAPQTQGGRRPSDVVHPPITLRSRRASQWTRHLKPH